MSIHLSIYLSQDKSNVRVAQTIEKFLFSGERRRAIANALLGFMKIKIYPNMQMDPSANAFLVQKGNNPFPLSLLVLLSQSPFLFLFLFSFDSSSPSFIHWFIHSLSLTEAIAKEDWVPLQYYQVTGPPKNIPSSSTNAGQKLPVLETLPRHAAWGFPGICVLNARKDTPSEIRIALNASSFRAEDWRLFSYWFPYSACFVISWPRYLQVREIDR